MSQRKISDEQLIAEYEKGKTYKQIAEEYGMAKRNVERLGARLAKRGLISTRRAPGFGVNGESLLVDKDGNVIMRWIKTARDRDEMERLMQAACDAFTEEIPRAEPNNTVPLCNDDLMVMYPIADHHMGMLAHHHETGDNYNISIAEKLIDEYFEYAISVAPNASKGLLVLLGDFFHFDGLSPVTPEHGNVLDADTRYSKLVYVGIRSIRKAINKLLDKHKTIEIQIVTGNHDPSSMIFLRAALAAVYENEPRIYVDVSPRYLHAVRFGRVLIGICHGDKMKKPDVRLSCLARDFKRDFGECDFVYSISGHLHSHSVTETNLGVDEIFGKMAASDAYAAAGGWRSYRYTSAVTYHKEFGEISRSHFRPEMIKDD
ncbi:TPA: hypothetical protein HNO18_06775 [Escherichia coli]|nr:hypothetical protein [Escherichia coli]